ncbi:azobenzene reductase [Bacillus mesophilus]|uniref:NAD(P)H-dependent oxidoreductase n=1 Tax=Bacillus mesophilus TaxID=1808955 RepID=A0A6M0QBH5_9BACI|nr:NADPH-dependent FMN reductase [Bacillus mesophilus]MBM7660059.1 azobenzene reductase [Bacillus mesophilus]NEY73714.1 NAD(P)H-dependent oxidoreductase [Bacillus mesophilus]
MNIVVFNGSPRRNGRTGIVAKYIKDAFKTEIIDLSLEDLPLFNGEDSQNELSSVKELRTRVTKADAVILASPEYHSGMSGALKNALDFLSKDQFELKPIGLIAIAGGGKGGMNALNNMRIVTRGVHGNPYPKQLILDASEINRNTNEIAPDAKGKIRSLIEEVIQFTEQLKK